MICGVDPGRLGALAVLHDDGSIAEIVDMPSVEVFVSGKPRLRVSAAGIAGFLLRWKEMADELTLIVEETQPMGKMGGTSSHALGKASGIVEGVAAGARIPLVPVRPAKWKRVMGLSADKGGVRLRAQQQWPEDAERFKLVKHDGRAEASFLALYGLRAAI